MVKNRDVACAYPYPASSITWKNSIAVFHTCGVPPSIGRIIFENIGWTENNSAALSSSVKAKTGVYSEGFFMAGTGGKGLRIREF